MNVMAKQLGQVTVRAPREWRAWLGKHHASSPGVWVVFYKGADAAKSIAYEDAVREALCFGWIDSLIRRLDDERYVRKFTPRTAGSKWSELNRKRWMELKRTGLLTPAGLASAPTGNTYATRPTLPELPSYIAKVFKADPKAWSFFQQLAPTYRRQFIGWIHTAKQTATRQKRMSESVALLAARKKLGLK